MAEQFELLALEARGKVGQSKSFREEEGNKHPFRVMRDGALAVAPWKQALVFEGRCYQVTVGTFSTPVTGGGAGTILDQDQPELIIDIPSARAIMLMHVRADCQLPLLAADSEEAEILLAIDRLAVTGATATQGTVETPVNMRTDIVGGSGLAVVSAVTTNTTAVPTLSMELAHPVKIGDVQGTAANAMWNGLFLDYEPEASPVIVGPAAVLLYWGGTVATTGFASVTWAEFVRSETI